MSKERTAHCAFERCRKAFKRGAKNSTQKFCSPACAAQAATKPRRGCSGCGRSIEHDNITGECAACRKIRVTAEAEERRKAERQARLDADARVAAGQATPEDKLRAEVVELQDSLKRAEQNASTALASLAAAERALGVLTDLDAGVETYRIKEKVGEGKSEGTVVVAASDWHLEETVGREVNGLNVFDPEVAKKRVETFFRGALRLTRLLQQDIKVDDMVLALLGDFITNQLHEDAAEKNSALPTQAIELAEEHLASGLEFLLDHSKLKIVLPCHSGNHARTTKRVRWAAENGHSLEYLMYSHLRKRFANESRLQFIVPDGYHSHVQVYGQTVRFHHGHAIKYQGGIGGIFIPAFKAIAQWNKARGADLDVFGHFHQSKDGGNFLSNGSLIGYNGFAVSIKADYEPPKQTLFLLDKKRGRTATWPILLDR